MNIIIIGSGMYVTGRGTDGFGTILPAIFEYIRSGHKVNKIIIIGSNGKNKSSILEKINKLKQKSNISCKIDIYPKKNIIDKRQYTKIIKKIKKPACGIVAVPDHLHTKVTMECLKNGLHTLVVKPLTSNLEEAKKLQLYANKNNLYGAVEFHKRFDKQNIMLRDTISNMDIGKPVYSVVEYSQRKSIPTKTFKSWVKKTNIFQYLGVHYVDIMYFVTKAKPKRVMATGQKNWLKTKGLNIYDAMQVNIEWKMNDGTSFNQLIITNWIDSETSSAMSDQKIKIIGTEGRFEADQKNRGITIFGDNIQMENPNPDFCRSYSNNGRLIWKGYGIDSIKTFLLDVDEINQNKKTPKELEGIRPTFKEALISTSIIEAANISIDNKSSWVQIKL